MNTLQLKEFDFNLPQELIAQYPVLKRDQARLMVVDRANAKITHDIFANIGKYLSIKSCIVLNNSKVIPARLIGRRENSLGRVEIFLLKKILNGDGYSYEALIRPWKRLKLNEKIQLNPRSHWQKGTSPYEGRSKKALGACTWGSSEGSFTVQIVDKENRIVRFNRKNISSQLKKHGHMPLPPYIKRADEPMDQEYYQTVYAKKNGSVASPTAGLHFTLDLLNQLRSQGHITKSVTLHINHATFRLVEEDDITRHQMHTEDYELTRDSFLTIHGSKKRDRKIVAVGTTACRVLETVADQSDEKSLKGSTSIFIYPGYKFKMTDVLITNFHLPRSTLFMLVCAFGGTRLLRQAYLEAIEQKYRFYSYGDAMVIL